MKGISSGLNHRADRGRSLSTEFRRINGLLNVELLQGIERRRRDQVVEILILSPKTPSK